MNKEARTRWNRRYADAQVWPTEPNARFAHTVAGLPAGKAVDLGCGEGRHALWLARQGWQVDAVDFSQVAVDRGQKQADDEGLLVNWIVADVGALPLQPRSYDLVALVFLHTSPDEREGWLETAANAVSAGGHFFYLGHDPANITAGAGGPRDPTLLPTVADVVTALDGFEIVSAEVVRREASSETGHGADSGVALDGFVFARRKEVWRSIEP